MKLKYCVFISFLLSVFYCNLSAQPEKILEVNFVLGYNIGATAPIPLPAEVRKINSYNPKFNPQAGINFNYSAHEKWGVGAGVAIDWKGMRVKDEVKYMHTSVVLAEGGDKLTGYFVGKNMTNVNTTYLTVPIYGTYRVNDKWRLKLGIYAAKTLSSTFDGNVNDGYIRIDTPTGQKQEIDGEGANFDFSDDVRDYDFGLLGGGEFKLTERLGIYGNLSWGLIPYFYKGSNPIEFTMNNIYGTIGISYRLR